MIRQLVHRVLEVPWVFEMQQRLCNDYSGIRKHFLDYVDGEGLDILDIGCSTGTCARAVFDMSRNHYTGIDIVPEYVERAGKANPHGTFLAMDARDIAFDDDSFDVVMFVGALHHMNDQIIHDCFAEIERVLRPNGVVLCAEPVFTPGKPVSNLFLRNDRGEYIRDEPGYRALFGNMPVLRQEYFRFSIHRFCSFVLGKQTASGAEPKSTAA